MRLSRTLIAIFITLTTISASAQERGSWSNLFGNSNGIDGSINALAIDPSGNVYVGGSFSEAGGVSVNNIAVWNGMQWSSVGDGFDNYVTALEIDGSGNVLAGGGFTKSDSLILNGIARWDGQKWHGFGSGFKKEFDLGDSTPVVWALEIDNTGKLFAGGDFTEVDGISARGIAVWNGVNWEEPGGGVGKISGCVDLTLDNVYAIHAADSGSVYIGGNFREVGGVVANGLAKWNGAEWSAMGEGIGASSCGLVWAFTEYNGDLFVGGSFSEMDGTAASGVAKWTGSAWDVLGGGVFGGTGGVYALAAADDGVYVGGQFTGVSTMQVGSIAKWTEQEWQMLGSGITSPGFLYAIGVHENDVYAGGFLVKEAGGEPSFGIALWQSGQSVAQESGPLLHSELELISVYPNPFTKVAKIQFTTSNTSEVHIQVYNTLGQLVSTPFEGFPVRGINTIEWGSKQLAAGVYVIKIQQNGRTEFKTTTRLSR